MGRRAFMELIAAVFAAFPFPNVSRAAEFDYRVEQCQLNFVVSGSRYLDPIFGLKVGDAVEIRADFFMAVPCYSVIASNERKLGYVPKRLIRALDNLRLSDARLSVVDYYGLPWKRYEVTISGQLNSDKGPDPYNGPLDRP